jgi:holo-[acyl-carrier protein] synthase
MIIGHGVDLVEHDSFERLVAQEEAFLKRGFTESEIASGKSSSDPVQWFASRWAVKEAVMKALGTGFTQGVSWHEITAISSETEAPRIQLTGTTKQIAEQKCVAHWHLTISHTKRFSIASVIAADDSR